MSKKPITSFSGKHAFLSNFYVGYGFTLDGIFYLTSEHAYQALKSSEEKERHEIAAAHSPGLAKRLGQHVSKRENWDSVPNTAVAGFLGGDEQPFPNPLKVKEMRRVLKAKFKNKELRKKLLDTGERELVEGNTWHDQTWGNCTCSRQKCASLPGMNWLGRLLMEERTRIRKKLEGKTK